MVIRVIVASEVRLYRDALRRVLQDAAGIALVGIAASAAEVVEQARRLAPIVIVVDTAMVEGFSGALPIARAPQIGGVMVFDIPEVCADVIACVPSGILGFVSRDGTGAVLLNAIRATHKPQQPQTQRGGTLCDLTVREMEILRLMQQGVSNKTISRKLGIGVSTVKNHVHSILAKLGVGCRGEAISLVYRRESSERGAPGNGLPRQAAMA